MKIYASRVFLKNRAQSLDLCQQEEVIHMEDWEPPRCVCIYAATFNPFGIINLGVFLLGMKKNKL